ncbi:MAG TPA: lipase family protein [bacterium]
MSEYFSDPSLLKPPVARAAYSDRTAWIMAQCSELAYKDFTGSELSKFLKMGGLRLIKTFSKTDIHRQVDTQAFLAQTRDYSILSFRGTQIKQWIDIETDLNIPFYKNKGGEVHRGFFEAFQVIAPDLIQALKKLKTPLYVTGHSLGGALATVAVMNLPNPDQIAACYTYGAPRVGNAEFVEAFYKVPVYRLVHASDIVPHLPFFAMGYCHPSSMRFLTAKGELITDETAWLRCFLQGLRTFLTFSWGRFIGDHSMKFYVEFLFKVAKSRNAHRKKRKPYVPILNRKD